MTTHNIEFLAEVDSTNTYLKTKASKQLLPAQYAVCTGLQLRGKGQRGNTWESAPFANVLASLLVKEPGAATHLSSLNNAAALAVVHTLSQYGINNATVKWPNDIYIGDRKIAGILTENSFANGKVVFSVVGIGLNVNQMQFGDYKATSIGAVTGLENDCTNVLHHLYDAFYTLVKQSAEQLLADVNTRLYKKEKYVTFEEGERMSNYVIKCMLKNGNLAVSDKEQWIELEHHKAKWVK